MKRINQIFEPVRAKGIRMFPRTPLLAMAAAAVCIFVSPLHAKENGCIKDGKTSCSICGSGSCAFAGCKWSGKGEEGSCVDKNAITPSPGPVLPGPSPFLPGPGPFLPGPGPTLPVPGQSFTFATGGSGSLTTSMCPSR